MAAAVLTSLSTSPVVLNNPPNGFSTGMGREGGGALETERSNGEGHGLNSRQTASWASVSGWAAPLKPGM